MPPAPYGMDYMFHGHGLLFGESYLGRRVHDLLSVMDLFCMLKEQKELNVLGGPRGDPGPFCSLTPSCCHRTLKWKIMFSHKRTGS